MIGTRLGPYEITAKLGEGGMGVVYRAKDAHLEREVALKVLPEKLAEDPERLARFAREARLLAQLNHPNIAQIHGLEVSGTTRALVMELVEGPTLAERLEQGALPAEEILSMARQIAEALEAAHEKGIVHRDLKPLNVKAAPGGPVKVLDFGLAKAMDPGAGAESPPHDLASSPTMTYAGTRAGMVLGTAAYMAPEQARGSAVDKRADVWAFGVILYEMLTGERLFGEGSVVDTLSAVMRKEIDLARLPASTPPRLRELVRRCLERDPKRRLRDIGEARIAMEDLGSGMTEDATDQAEPSRATRRSSLRLALSVTAVAAVAGVLLGAAISGWLRHPEPREPLRIHPLTFSGSDVEPAASPDGKLVAFTSRRDGVSRIWIKQIVGGGEAPLTRGPDGLARFSPDGASLLFVRDLGPTQAVYRTGLVGGEPRRLIDGATAADWSPDGRRIGFLRDRGGAGGSSEVGVYDVASGKERVLAELGVRIVQSPRWSPDGREIAFSSGSWAANDWLLQKVDVATGQVTAIPPGEPLSPLGGLAWSGAGSTLFYVQAPGVMGDITGTGSLVMRCDVRSGERRRVLWADGLSWMVSTVAEISPTDVLAPGRLLFGQRLRRQNLREVELGGAGTAPISRVLAEGSSIDRQPTSAPDGREILFSSNRGGNLDLWTLDRATGALRQVTDDPAQDWDPAYTPGGRHIVWSSDRGSGDLEVWMADADGSSPRQVTHDGVSAQNPTATPDGTWIVYWSGNPETAGLWKIHPDGSGAAPLVRTAAAIGMSEVSPDGRYVLYVDQDRTDLLNTIRFIELASGRAVPFTIEVHYTLGATAIIWGRARWSPDGRAIYFVGENEEGLSGVYIQDFVPGRDTTATRRPVAGFSPEYVTESLGLSPDGTRLTISTGQESSSVMVAEGVAGALPAVRSTP